MIKIAIIGFGTVGQGVAEVLIEKKEYLTKVVGDYKVVAVADSKGSITGDFDLNHALKVKRDKKRLPDGLTALEIVKNLDFDLLIETTTTNIEDGEPGLTHIKEALKRGKDVITSNKGPLVVSYKDLMKISKKNNCNLLFEATVGGAMPVIKFVRRCLAGNKILSIKGILNGTCNYILSRMEKEKMPFKQILAEAQELKIAEADPSYDVDGIDAASKLVIVANALLDIDAKLKDVKITGIREITPEAFDVAMEKGYTIRLIAEVGNELKVSPRLIPLNHPLVLQGTLNALQIKTDLAGDVVVVGKGAGKRETASAIISDFIDLYANQTINFI